MFHNEMDILLFYLQNKPQGSQAVPCFALCINLLCGLVKSQISHQQKENHESFFPSIFVVKIISQVLFLKKKNHTVFTRHNLILIGHLS